MFAFLSLPFVHMNNVMLLYCIVIRIQIMMRAHSICRSSVLFYKHTKCTLVQVLFRHYYYYYILFFFFVFISHHILGLNACAHIEYMHAAQLHPHRATHIHTLTMVVMVMVTSRPKEIIQIRNLNQYIYIHTYAVRIGIFFCQRREKTCMYIMYACG